jgi:hypothetical protein
VDDKVITCDVPSKAVEGSTVKLDLVLPWIKHGQATSIITDRLTTLRESRPPLDEVIRTVVELEQIVQEWHVSLPSTLRSENRDSHTQEPVDSVHFLDIHFKSLQSIMAIHSILCHSWDAPAIQMELKDLPEFEKYSAKSLSTTIEASRQVIRKLRYINIDVCCPKR